MWQGRVSSAVNADDMSPPTEAMGYARRTLSKRTRGLGIVAGRRRWRFSEGRGTTRAKPAAEDIRLVLPGPLSLLSGIQSSNLEPSPRPSFFAHLYPPSRSSLTS